LKNINIFRSEYLRARLTADLANFSGAHVLTLRLNIIIFKSNGGVVTTLLSPTTMRRVLLRRGAREGDVLVPSMDDHETEHDRISSLVKKPFRCLVGGRDGTERDYEGMHVMSPEEQYIPPGKDVGFEVQEAKKKKQKPRSFRKKTEDALSKSLEEPPRSADPMAPYSLRGNRSYEDLPPGVNLDSLARRRTHSFADAIPPGKKNDPLDNESIRDVSKALREMERKLEAAGTEGKKVSRTKVMKALLTVVDQLDDEYDYKCDLPPSSTNPSADLYRTWTGGSNSADEEAVALDRHLRNVEQMRELTITPNKDYSGRAESPWKGDKPSFSKLNGVKAVSTAETEAEPEYFSSSSDEEEEEEDTHFSEESDIKPLRGQASNKGSFAHAVYDDDTRYWKDTGGFKKGKSRKGTFAHAVSPSAANPNSAFDLFNLDMKDPAVQDALSDLLWIQSPTKSIMEATNSAVVTPDHHSLPRKSSNQQVLLDKMRKENQSMLSYNEEDEFHDKPDVGEETTSATTHSSRRKKKTRENSWWQRRSRAALKPPSKDTPMTQEQSRQIQTRVTVKTEDAEDAWESDDMWDDL